MGTEDLEITTNDQENLGGGGKLRRVGALLALGTTGLCIQVVFGAENQDVHAGSGAVWLSVELLT